MRAAGYILPAVLAAAAVAAMATDRALIPAAMVLLVVAAALAAAAWLDGRGSCGCCPDWGYGCAHEQALTRALAEQAADDTDGLTVPPIRWWTP